MKIIVAEYNFELDEGDGLDILQRIEQAGRVCYKSEGNNRLGELDKTKKFVKMILERGHESVLEHEKVTVRIICDRGVTHELVRHRIASYSQESTRYCNYGGDKFDGEVTFIDIRHFLKKVESIAVWERACRQSEENYLELIANGEPPQFARSVLINSLKTEIVTTANLREWRHIFKLRTSKAAHPQMQEIMGPLLKEFQELIPIVFDDIEVGA